MKKSTLFLATAALSISLISCGGKNEAAAEGATTEATSTEATGNTLEGTYKIAKAEGPGASSWVGASCKFDATNMAMNEVPYPYTVSNDTITAKETFGDAKYTFKFENNQLVLQNIKNGQKFVMDKQ